MLKAILKVSIWKSQWLTTWFFRYLATESQGQSLSVAMPLFPAFNKVPESLVRGTCTNKNYSLHVYRARQDAFVILKHYSANGGGNTKLSKTVDIFYVFCLLWWHNTKHRSLDFTNYICFCKKRARSLSFQSKLKPQYFLSFKNPWKFRWFSKGNIKVTTSRKYKISENKGCL